MSGGSRALATALLAWMLLPSPALGVENDFTLWPGVLTSVGITQDLSASLLLQPRLANDASELQTMVVRTWLAVKPLDWLELAAGYDFIPLLEPVYVVQHRAWPQVSLSHRWSRLSAGNRTRLEFRFIENVSPVALRLRNATRFTLSQEAGPWYGVGSEEVFFDLNDAAPIRPGFAENRLFVGVGRHLGDVVRLEGGYQMRYVDLPLGDVIQHTLLLTLFLDVNR